MVDKRDGNKYNIVGIGDQIWMAENLRYAGSGGHQITYHTLPGADDGQSDFLYNWESAKEACPAGWHLPTKTDFNTMFNYVAVQLTTAINPNEETLAHVVFSTLNSEYDFATAGPGTCLQTSEQEITCSPSEYSTLWTATVNISYPYSVLLDGSTAFNNNFTQSALLSVRCVKDN
jgi:uncharacterized protein (TIGR02145 family)